MRFRKEGTTTEIVKSLVKLYDNYLDQEIVDTIGRMNVQFNKKMVLSEDHPIEFNCTVCMGKIVDKDSQICKKCIAVYHEPCFPSHVCRQRSK